MAELQHQNLAAGRWFTLSLAEQLGNVGSEIGRAINWQKKGKLELQNKAADRALELLDLTIADKRWQNRLKEILWAKNLTADYFYGKNEFKETPEQLEKYFYYFAVKARSCE